MSEGGRGREGEEHRWDKRKQDNGKEHNKMNLAAPDAYYIHVLMRDEKEGRKKQGLTNNTAKQHSTPKAVTFPKKNDLPRVGLEPMCTCTSLSRASIIAFLHS